MTQASTDFVRTVRTAMRPCLASLEDVVKSVAARTAQDTHSSLQLALALQDISVATGMPVRAINLASTILTNVGELLVDSSPLCEVGIFSTSFDLSFRLLTRFVIVTIAEYADFDRQHGGC